MNLKEEDNIDTYNSFHTHIHDSLDHNENHIHVHSHTHTHTETKNVLNRLSRLEGQIKGIKNMVTDGEDCSKVLIQMAAVRSALNGAAKVIINDHMDNCIVDAVKDGDMNEVKEFMEVMKLWLNKF